MSVKQKLPNWFNGALYSQGETVANPFTGEEIELTNVELSLYDFIMGANAVFEMGLEDESLISDFQKALRWFQKNNIEAYMALLD